MPSTDSVFIEVAFVGRDLRELMPLGSDSYAESFFADDENTRAWDDRLRVTLSVEDDERLVEIFDRAVSLADVVEADWSKKKSDFTYGTYRYVALRDDDSPIPLVHRLTDRPVLVDAADHAVWGQGLYGETTFAQLRAAAEAGAVPGDPTQIYLNVRLAPAGGEAFVEWELLFQIWDIGWKVAAALATASGVHDLYAKVRDRLDGYRVVESKSEEWLRRNGRPDLFREMLRGDPWSPRVLAGLLGCTTSEAEQILALYGYDRESSEKWVYLGGDVGLDLPVGDLAARVVKAYSNEARHRYAATAAVPPEELEALLTEILNQALENGEITGLGSDESLRRYGRPD